MGLFTHSHLVLLSPSALVTRRKKKALIPERGKCPFDKHFAGSERAREREKAGERTTMINSAVGISTVVYISQNVVAGVWFEKSRRMQRTHEKKQSTAKKQTQDSNKQLNC